MLCEGSWRDLTLCRTLPSRAEEASKWGLCSWYPLVQNEVRPDMQFMSARIDHASA